MGADGSGRAPGSGAGPEHTPQRWRVAALVAVILVGTMVLATGQYVRELQAEAARDEALAARTAEVFEDVVHGTLVASGTAGALVDEDGTIDAARFEQFAASIVRQPGVRSVAWQQLVPADELADFEAATGTDVWERSQAGTAAVASRREAHLPVVEAWPEPYTEIVGFDLLSEPVRAEAVASARERGEPVITAPLELAPDSQTGVLIVVPLYDPGLPAATVSERQAAFTGAVTVGHFADVFLRHVVQQADTQVRVTDGADLLVETDPPPAEDGAFANAVVAGREWTVEVRHPVRASIGNALWITALGGLLALAVGWSFRQTTQHADRLKEAHDELAALVAAIQHGALRSSPTLPPALESAVRYEPAAEHARLGGDWYDLLSTPDGRLFVTVGDVGGHGIDAVTHMQQVRQVIAAFAYEGHAPSAVLRLTDELLGTEPMAEAHLTTVWVGLLDPDTGHLRYASAGHPPAILAAPGRRPAVLEPAPAPPLNTGLGAALWMEHEAQLPSDGVLLVYTDGVVESRSGGIDAGLPAVLDTLGDPGAPLETLADRLMGARPEPGRDDAALTLIRRGSARR